MTYTPILKKGIRKYNPKKDYCTCAPEGLFGCKYSKACYWHDRQYRNEVVNRKSRLGADFNLWMNIIKEAYKVRKTSIIWSSWVGRAYFFAVRFGAKKHYDKV